MPDVQPITRKVLALNFRPTVIPGEWPHTDDLISQYIQKMKELSQELLIYQLVKKLDVDNYPVLLGARQYNHESWLQAIKDDQHAYRDQNKNYLMVDYHHLIQEYEFLQAVQSQQIDEVWMFGGPYFGFYESCMIGRGAFWCNGPAIKLDCTRFVVMGFNYQREVREMVHDYGHRAESILAKHFGSEAFLRKLYDLQPLPAPRNAFEQFLLAHGTVHRTPGNPKDYSQDEFTWMEKLEPEWWPLTIDPNRVQTAPGWYEFLASLLSRLGLRR